MSSQKVNLTRQGFETRAYKNAIDTSFSQLVTPPPPLEETITVDEFFEAYNTLFYEIPSTGVLNSHEFLIKRSTEYIGFTEETEQDIQVLLDEITQLREQLLVIERELRDTQISASIALTSEGNISEISEGTSVTAQPFTIGGSIQ